MSRAALLLEIQSALLGAFATHYPLWNSVATIHPGTRIAASRERHRWSQLRDDLSHRHFVSHNVRDRIDFPSAGWLRVRLNVPDKRQLEAIASIDTRPALLVDMPRRYR